MARVKIIKRGKIYYASYTINGARHRLSLGTDNKTDAERQAAAIAVSVTQKTDADKLEAVKAQILQHGTFVVRSAVRKLRIVDAWAYKPYTYTVKRLMRPLRDARGNYNLWRKFERFCTANGVIYLADVTHEFCEKYLRTLADRGISASTQNRSIVCLRVCFDLWAIDPNPWGKIRKRAEINDRREVLTRAQIEKIIESTDNPELRCLIACLAYTGKRLGEVAALMWENLENDVFTIFITKSRKYSTFPVLPELAAELDRYGRKKTGAIFPTYCVPAARWGSYTGKFLSRKIVKVINRCGIGDGNGVHYGAHSFRHSFATACALSGIPQGVIQGWLGHSSPAITKIYTDHYAIEEKKRIMSTIKFR